MSETIEYEEVTGFKNTLTGSIPITETRTLTHTPDTTTIKKQCCAGCAEVKNIALTMCTDGKTMPLCRTCRKPYVINITAKSLISQLPDKSITLSNMKVLRVYDELRELVDNAFICAVSTHSTALQNKVTKVKTVEMYKRLGMKLSKIEPVVTICPEVI